MALEYQAFIDDSKGEPNGDFALGGYIATAEVWAQFSKDWEELLPHGTRAKNGKFRFKMKEMTSQSGMERVRHFYEVIEKYPLIPISCCLSLADFFQAFERMEILLSKLNFSNDFAKWKNPYFFLFRGLMDQFHLYREKIKNAIPLSEKVDFYFDNQSEKSYILGTWNEIVAANSEEAQQYYGATPRFEDDQDFLPLQAADLWAWWVREWHEEDASPTPTKMRNLDFGNWRGRKRFMISMYYSEDQILDTLQGLVFANLPQGFHFRDGPSK
jgi:hypothetical protein